MFSISDTFFCFLIIFSFINILAASDNTKDDGRTDRGAHSDRGGLWFGPRLGKRSLALVNEDDRDSFLRLLEAADALKYYYEQMPYEMQIDAAPKVMKKVIFTPKLGRALEQEKKYENIDFTPRLGRRLPERMSATPADEERPDPVMADPRSNYFSPRLGRNFNLTPRLGRELIYDFYPESRIRVARSINKTKST